MHKLVYHEDQQIEDGYRQIEHRYRKENDKLKFRTLMETNIFGNPNIEMKRITNTQI